MSTKPTSSDIGWMFRRSVSRYSALKALVESGGKGNMEELGTKALEGCPISYSTSALQNSVWRALRRKGLVSLKSGKMVQLSSGVISQLRKEIQQIESTISDFNNKGIKLPEKTLGESQNQISRRKQVLNFLIDQKRGIRRDELVQKFGGSPKQIHKDINIISEALATTTGHKFVGAQISNKGIWIEYYLPFKNIQLV